MVLTTRPRKSGATTPTVVVAAAAAGSAVAGALAHVDPTTLRWADLAWPALLCATVVLAARRAPRLAVAWLAAGAVVASMSASVSLALLAAIGLGIAVAVQQAPVDSTRRGVLSSVVAAVAVPVLLRQGAWGFHGASALLAMVAIVPVLWPAAVTTARHGRSRAGRWSRRNRLLAGAIIVAPVLVLVASVMAAYWASGQMDRALSSARRGDTVRGARHLHTAGTGFTLAHWLAGGPLVPLRLVPVLSQHVQLLTVATGEAAAVSHTGGDLLAISRYGDLKGDDGRIDLERLRAVTRPVRRTEALLETARRRIGRTASPWLVGPAQARLVGLQDEMGAVHEQADLVGDLTEILPKMLGGDRERVYFVAFLNPAEERGGGGFLGSYAELRARNGKIRMTRSGSIHQLINAGRRGTRTLTGPPDYLERYGRFRPAYYLQDIPFSPHFPYTAEVISQLYPQSGGSHLDGVLAVDPYALAAMLNFTGPIRVDGIDRPLTAKNAARVLVRDQYLIFNPASQSSQVERRDTLEQLAERTFRRLTHGSLPDPRKLTSELGPMVRQRRLQMWSRRADEERLLRRVGLDGSMETRSAADYLLVSHQNLGNSKIDTYLQRSTTYRATVDPRTGHETATVTVKLHNKAPARGLPRYIIGNNRNEPSGSNVMQLSVYTHLDFQGGVVDGEVLAVRSEFEAGAKVYTARLVVGAGQTQTVVFNLAGRANLTHGEYQLRVLPQPTVIPDSLTVDVRASSRPDARGRVLVRRPPGPLLEPITLDAPVAAG